MKKITIVILAILYLTTSSGLIMNMHYCMGKLVALDFLHNKGQLCSNCGMKETDNKDCCKQEKKLLKVEKDQKSTFTSYQLPQYTNTIINNYVEITSGYVSSLKELHPLYDPRLRGRSLQLFIHYSVFRI